MTVLLWLVACANTEDSELFFGVDPVPLSALVRPGSAGPSTADTWIGEDPVLDYRTAKARPTFHRGGQGHAVATLTQYVPAGPNSADAAVESTTLYTIADLDGVPAARRHGPQGAVVATSPWEEGILALVCGTADPSVFVWTRDQSAFAGFAYGVPYPSVTWASLGLCDGDGLLGVSEGSAFLVAARGEVHRADVAEGLVVTPLGPSPVALAEAVWLGERGGVVAGVTWADVPRYADSDGVAATADVDGEPLGDPVWRAADGSLRLATTAGLYAWDPPAAAALVQTTPAPGVDAAWQVVGPQLVARQVEPNPEVPELAVPVATEVLVADDDGWVLHPVPVTPCADDAACRDYGESEVLGVVGAAGAVAPVYDVWLWTAEEAHETWASPE